jgi:fatty-acid desaturase
MKVFLVKELMTKEHLFINKWYFAIIFTWLVFLSFINIDLIYFTWVLPVMLVQLSQNCFNYFAHMHGHRNFETRDTSTNNIWLWPFILGDAWHNNHHKNPGNFTTKIKWWEVDSLGNFIIFIRKKS